ncbi:MAG: hypothetical protein L0Z50_26830, partial [Verrucomicrobiales bacterium]|nr:hypothetical protein [Verrucomicrobiales bacterium]
MTRLTNMNDVISQTIALLEERRDSLTEAIETLRKIFGPPSPEAPKESPAPAPNGHAPRAPRLASSS